MGEKFRSHCKCTAALLQLTIEKQQCLRFTFPTSSFRSLPVSDSGCLSPSQGLLFPASRWEDWGLDRWGPLPRGWVGTGRPRTCRQLTKCLGSVDSEFGWLFMPPFFFPLSPCKPFSWFAFSTFLLWMRNAQHRGPCHGRWWQAVP